jgi:hypothetical protein
MFNRANAVGPVLAWARCWMLAAAMTKGGGIQNAKRNNFSNGNHYRANAVGPVLAWARCWMTKGGGIQNAQCNNFSNGNHYMY